MIDRPPASLCVAAEAPSLASHPHPLTAAQHGALLHGRSPGAAAGQVALATKKPGEGRREKAYPADELAEVLAHYAGQSDVYISTRRFSGWRRIAWLAQCEALERSRPYHNPCPSMSLRLHLASDRNAVLSLPFPR